MSGSADASPAKAHVVPLPLVPLSVEAPVFVPRSALAVDVSLTPPLAPAISSVVPIAPGPRCTASNGSPWKARRTGEAGDGLDGVCVPCVPLELQECMRQAIAAASCGQVEAGDRVDRLLATALESVEERIETEDQFEACMSLAKPICTSYVD